MGKEIGIDLGTTNTVVSYINKKGKLRQLRYDSRDIIPSVVYFNTKDDYIIGNRAKTKMDLAKDKAGIANFKPRIGENGFKYEVVAENGDEFKITPKKVAKLFLNKIIRGVEDKLLKEFGSEEGVIDRAVITVPAKFNPVDKEATKKAAKGAGLKDTRLAAEPTAAAIAYQNDLGIETPNQQDGAILVYDFGGGTFDVSIIKRENGVFKEIATGGDRDLGGNKLTAILEEEILERINDEYGLYLPMDEDDFDEEDVELDEVSYHQNIVAVHQAANHIKEELSSEETTEEPINIILPGNKAEVYDIDFSRDELEKCIKKEVKKTVDITLKTIKEATEKDVRKIDQIVLAGGSSNIPLVKEMLDKELKGQDIVYSDDVSTMISRGAAVMAQKIDQFNNMTQQITNSQLGIAVTEGVHFNKFQVIIPENEPLPCTKKRKFKLARDGQRRLDIAYYEYDVKNYPKAIRVDEDGINEIDTLIIDNLPPNLKKDNTDVEVEFKAQKDGSLDITVDVKDSDGNSIKSEGLSITKESDLE